MHEQRKKLYSKQQAKYSYFSDIGGDSFALVMGCKEDLHSKAVLLLLWTCFQAVSHLPMTPNFHVKLFLGNLDNLVIY